jgi:hypothetical protein
VPTLSDNDKLDLSSVSWILVIEKEVDSMTLPKEIDAEALQASFRSLIGSAEWGHVGSNGVVLTV